MPFFETKFTNVKVTDINDKIIESGVCNELPKNLILQISSEFDIKVVVSKNNVVQNKFFIKAGKIFDGVNADFDVEVKIFQDLECVWSVKYELSQKEISKVDAELFLKLAHDRGKKVKISHTLGSLIDKLANFSKVRSWLYQNIRAGFVSEESYLLLRNPILGEI